MRACVRTILSVEDSSDEIFFLQHAFDQLGYGERVHFARDGREAVDYLSGTGIYADRALYPRPCVILTDLKMPTMDGFDFLKWLRRESDYRNTPAFVLTSSTLDSDQHKAQLCGANGYFQKPMVGGSLVAVLQKMESDWLPYLSRCTGYAPRLCEQ